MLEMTISMDGLAIVRFTTDENADPNIQIHKEIKPDLVARLMRAISENFNATVDLKDMQSSLEKSVLQNLQVNA